MILLQLYSHQLLVFVLVLTRISGLVMVAPIFGSHSVPVRIRAFLAIGLSLIVAPLQGPLTPSLPTDLLHVLLMLGREILLGLSVGLVVLILFTGLQVAGQVMGQMSGMSLADVFDPTFNADVPVLAQLLDVAALAAFVAIGGHRQVLGVLLDTFRMRPPGADDIPPELVSALTAVVSESFIIGFRAAAPVMVALLLAALILGLISRTLPQLNIIAVGFGVNTLILLAVLSVCFGAMIDVVCARSEVVIAAFRGVFL